MKTNEKKSVFFERQGNQDDAHVDERAHRFYSWGGYSGGGGRGWDSTAEGLRPTTTLGDNYTKVCAYCGRLALPIQKRVWDNFKGCSDFVNKGHCCVCKDAMDELEMVDQMEEIKKKFNAALRDCQAAMPKTNPAIVDAFIDRKAEKLKKDLKFWNDRGSIQAHALDKTGLKLSGPLNKEGDYDD